MPVSIIENIALEILDRLSGMVGDTANYPIDIQEVIRPTRFGGFTPIDRQIVLTEGVESVVPELSCPGSPPAVASVRAFNIRCHLMPSERSDEAIDAQINEFTSNVKKAICTPASSWHTFGGNALFAEWGAIQPFVADGGIDGINMPLRVTYRVSENDPYTQR